MFIQLILAVIKILRIFIPGPTPNIYEYLHRNSVVYCELKKPEKVWNIFCLTVF